MYTEYVNNHEKATEVLQKSMASSDRFKRFLDSMQTDPRSGGLTLEALLIMPIQRIPRYRLLLEQMLKSTPESHPDFQSVQAAVALVSNVADKIEANLKARDNAEIMLRIQKLFGDNVSIMSPGRFFVMEEVLLKQCRKADKPYHVMLFNDALIYAAKQLTGYKLKHLLDIDFNFFFYDLTDTSSAQNRIQITSSRKSFVLLCPSVESKQTWLQALTKCKKKFISGEEDTAAGKARLLGEEAFSAPVWTQDSEKVNCELCSMPFSIVRRRHHCRACGKLVCAGCSKMRLRIARFGWRKKKRVCDHCGPKYDNEDKPTIPCEENSSMSRGSTSFNSSSSSLVGMRVQSKSSKKLLSAVETIRESPSPREFQEGDILEAVTPQAKDDAENVLEFDTGDMITILRRESGKYIGQNKKTLEQGIVSIEKCIKTSEEDSLSDDQDLDLLEDEDDDIEEKTSLDMKPAPAKSSSVAMMKHRFESVFSSFSSSPATLPETISNPDGPCKKCLECKGFSPNSILRSLCKSCGHSKTHHVFAE